jgi:hypothetical protein
MKPHGLTVEKSHHLPGDHHGPVACQNCGHVFTGKYCPECSQRADTHRITWHYIWHELPHSIWHVDKGIAFTLRELFTRPGYTIREFLDGKRVNHYRPLALVLLLGALLVFLSQSLGVRMSAQVQQTFSDAGDSPSEALKAFQSEVNQFTEKNQTLISLLTIPITSFFLWLFFRKKSRNYPEHLVANTFLAVVSFFLSLILIVLIKIAGGTMAGFAAAFSLISLASFGYHVWGYLQLFKGEMRRRSIAWRAGLGYLLGTTTFFILMTMGMGTYLFLTHFDDLKREIRAKKARTEQIAPTQK